MKRFQWTRELLGKEITAEVLCLPQGVRVSVFGGDLPHIGAVSIAAPEGTCSTVEFPGHRDGTVSRRWADALAKAGFCPAVVEAGIHYDGLSREGIAEVLALTDNMLSDILDALSGTQDR